MGERLRAGPGAGLAPDARRTRHLGRELCGRPLEAGNRGGRSRAGLRARGRGGPSRSRGPRGGGCRGPGGRRHHGRQRRRLADPSRARAESAGHGGYSDGRRSSGWGTRRGSRPRAGSIRSCGTGGASSRCNSMRRRLLFLKKLQLRIASARSRITERPPGPPTSPVGLSTLPSPQVVLMGEDRLEIGRQARCCHRLGLYGFDGRLRNRLERCAGSGG